MKKRLSKTSINGFINYGIVIAAFLLLQLLMAQDMISNTLKSLLVPVCCYIVMAISLNLTVGILGELSLGHAGFMSLGAFSGIVAAMALPEAAPGLRLVIAILVGSIAGALGGVPVGVPKLASFTAGFILILITLFVVQNLVASRAGRAIMALRDNRIAAESVGIHVTKYKLMAFVISAALAGAAGALFGLNYSSTVSSKFGFNTSILILVFVVLGGLGSIRGSIISAALLYILPEMLRGFEFITKARMLIYAIILIAVMLTINNPALKSLLGERELSLAGLLDKLKSGGKSKEKGGAGQ